MVLSVDEDSNTDQCCNHFSETCAGYLSNESTPGDFTH